MCCCLQECQRKPGALLVTSDPNCPSGYVPADGGLHPRADAPYLYDHYTLVAPEFVNTNTLEFTVPNIPPYTVGHESLPATAAITYRTYIKT